MRPYNPLAPRRPKAVRHDSTRYVRAMIMPLLAQLNREFAGKSREASGLTDVLAQHLASQRGQTHDIYAGAQQQQSAMDTAFANRLSGAGASLNAEQNRQLALAGQAPTTGAADLGRGAANAGYGIGSASLARLIAQGAAAENYAGTLPGIARLGGQQHLRQLEGERSLQAGALRSKIPGLIEQIFQDEQNREFQKAAAGLSYGGTIAGIQGQNQRASQANRVRMAAIRAANQRTGLTLRERAIQNGLTNAQQARRDRENERHHRQQEKIARYKAHHPGKGGKTTEPPSAHKSHK